MHADEINGGKHYENPGVQYGELNVEKQTAQAYRQAGGEDNAENILHQFPHIRVCVLVKAMHYNNSSNPENNISSLYKNKNTSFTHQLYSGKYEKDSYRFLRNLKV